MALAFSKRISGTKAYYNLIRRLVFPRSTTIIVAASFVFSTLGLGISFLIAQRNLMSFVVGVSWGITILVLPSFVSNLLLYFTIMKEDPLFYLRRCLAFSLFTTTTWVIIFIICSILASVPGFVFPDFAIVVGLFAVMPMRSVAVFSMSKTSFAKRTLFSLMEPTLTALFAVIVFGGATGRIAVGWVLSSILGLAFAFALIATIESQGRKIIGFSPIRMFRAFLTDWLEAKNHELESYLNELGVETELDAAAFAFRRKADSKIKGVILVSNFHPGPFLNIGSSVLPFLFQSVMERRFHAVGIVPHGVSGHEHNLVSQEQNARVIDWVITNLNSAEYVAEATPVKRSTNEIATATCQVFDGSALVTMTASPHDMEDISTEVATRLVGQTRGRFRHLALIDAHNCLTEDTAMPPERIAALEEAALSSLQSVATGAVAPFKVGVARSIPREFTLKDGFGPGGIAVAAIEVNGQRFAYITIDGNNMVKGLREEILATAKQVGFEDAEVMTTDTHMVNGIVSARLGYHLVGEVGSRTALLNCITTACRKAIENLEPCEVRVVSGQIPVTTLGSKSLRRVMSLVYRNSKLTTLTLFPLVIVLAALSLIFLV
jgi:putative membrane protein